MSFIGISYIINDNRFNDHAIEYYLLILLPLFWVISVVRSCINNYKSCFCEQTVCFMKIKKTIYFYSNYTYNNYALVD